MAMVIYRLFFPELIVEVDKDEGDSAKPELTTYFCVTMFWHFWKDMINFV